ncbi:hypothetical protein [Lysobacter enzymogenes]|uniref:hypothetical protein n=1 Tax=Lysobacter enzymogenes TaxID=69 RepID=UPI0008971C2F|nr:hypothetical protein [Lysobacter enzymogenes]SDY25159.1 hypothetical protein SAMN05421681_11512 [Lysobacter enzymogenes]
MPAERAPWRTAALAALFFIAVAVIALRQDANWDLRNYHLYTPLAWLEGRLAQDIAPAQLQTWHNPTVDIPFALMVRAGLGGLPITLWLAIPSLLALYFALRLLDTLMPAQRSRARTWIAGFVIMTGAAMYPGTAAIFNDHIVGMFVLGALLWWAQSQGRRGPFATWLPVGLLAGAAAGFKLTGVTYCLGFIAAALVAGPLRQLPARILGLAIGGGVAVAVCWGPWGWYVWKLHANPLFPYFNQWFLSPDTIADSWRDARYVPRSLIDLFDPPLQLLRRSRHYSEPLLADPRLLLGLCALGAWLWLLRPGARAAEPVAVADPAAATAQANAVALRWPLLAFVAVSYFAWAGVYGIYRYLLPLEVLCSLLIVGAVSMLFAHKRPVLAMLAAMVLVVVPTKHPNWGRDSFRTPMIAVKFPPLPAGSVVLTSTEHPIAYAVAFLPHEVPAMAVRNNFMDPQRCTRLQERVERTVAANPGPLWLLRPVRPDPPASDRIALYGLSVSAACTPLDNNMGDLELCPLARAPFAPICVKTAQ